MLFYRYFLLATKFVALSYLRFPSCENHLQNQVIYNEIPHFFSCPLYCSPCDSFLSIWMRLFCLQQWMFIACERAHRESTDINFNICHLNIFHNNWHKMNYLVDMYMLLKIERYYVCFEIPVLCLKHYFQLLFTAKLLSFLIVAVILTHSVRNLF